MTTRLAPICFGCTRLRASPNGPLLCDAFPEGIPTPILLSDADHRRPYAGDSGKVFDAKTLDDEQYATLIFDMTDEDIRALG